MSEGIPDEGILKFWDVLKLPFLIRCTHVPASIVWATSTLCAGDQHVQCGADGTHGHCLQRDIPHAVHYHSAVTAVLQCFCVCPFSNLVVNSAAGSPQQRIYAFGAIGEVLWEGVHVPRTVYVLWPGLASMAVFAAVYLCAVRRCCLLAVLGSVACNCVCAMPASCQELLLPTGLYGCSCMCRSDGRSSARET